MSWDRFDFREAYDRLELYLESIVPDVHVTLTENDHGSRLLVQVGRSHQCRGGFVIDRPSDAIAGGVRHKGVLTIKSGMSYRLRLDDSDMRLCLMAIWRECERQGVLDSVILPS